ncbi:MAG: hypothetical protein V1929_08835, partial [bacterium]
RYAASTPVNAMKLFGSTASTNWPRVRHLRSAQHEAEFQREEFCRAPIIRFDLLAQLTRSPQKV